MKYSTTALSKLFEHRYKFIASIYNIQKKEYRNVTIFLDTGCFNTMIPRYLAERSGRSLGFKMTYSLGGNILEAEAFSIEKLMIGDIVLERIVAFAGEYKGGYEDDIILGTNIINNWEMIISKKAHSFRFREDPPENLPNKTNIYQNYFNRERNYIYIQDS
ncbi:MAG: aspartyl protease family protein [Treponema sp.]|nr:aspartyl protease family protein [Treponema sp.]